jgi:hypothetical protein
MFFYSCFLALFKTRLQLRGDGSSRQPVYTISLKRKSPLNGRDFTSGTTSCRMARRGSAVSR